MVKVKICGNRTLDDVEITGGADAQGFIVDVPSSPRNLDLCWAKWLVRTVKLFNVAVLVTQASEPERLAQLTEEVRPDVLQIHKELSLSELQRIRRAIPAPVKLCSLLSVNEPVENLIKRALVLAQPPLDALLLDSRRGAQLGGTSRVHDWQVSRAIREAVQPFPVILAGGITPQNVIEAIRAVRPYALDVSSGVEEQGRKSPVKVQALLERVHAYAYGHQVG